MRANILKQEVGTRFDGERYGGVSGTIRYVDEESDFYCCSCFWGGLLVILSA